MGNDYELLGGFPPIGNEGLGLIVERFSLLLKRNRSGSFKPTSFPMAISSIFSTNFLIVGR